MEQCGTVQLRIALAIQLRHPLAHYKNMLRPGEYPGLKEGGHTGINRPGLTLFEIRIVKVRIEPSSAEKSNQKSSQKILFAGKDHHDLSATMTLHETETTPD